MMRPDYRNFISHSAKGSTWEKHKYIKRIDGTYYYPENYEDGRHLSDKEKKNETKSSGSDLSKKDVENLANEVISGKYGNGQQRKDLLGENYAEIQKRVNELMLGSTGSIKVSKKSKKDIKKAEETIKNSPVSQTKIDMSKVLSVYKKRR